ncbi:MAG: universal stress protein [Granulosicoccus sp.]
MTYQTILVNLSNESTADTALRVADGLAERHTAHLLGMHIKPPMELPVSAEIPVSVELAHYYEDQHRQIEGRVRALFDRVTSTASYVADWRSVDAGFKSVADTLVDQGNTADLIILGQAGSDAATKSERRLSEYVLLACGRPVLVVPWQYEATEVAARVLLAWDGRRESTRAVFGALPMLRHASEVRLHRINPPDQDRHHIVGSTEELANTLSRHGVRVDVHHSDAKGGEVAQELLGFARDMDADTLVMGCYGHSRLWEFFLGSTTRQMFTDARIPVLMSN